LVVEVAVVVEFVRFWRPLELLFKFSTISYGNVLVNKVAQWTEEVFKQQVRYR
jgi:hypothetical protein